MRARTIGQIALLIANHLGATTPGAVAEPAPVAATAESASAVDIDAISDEEIERLLGSETHAPETEAIGGAER
jgi:hypothetical protein